MDKTNEHCNDCLPKIPEVVIPKEIEVLIGNMPNGRLSKTINTYKNAFLPMAG